MGSYYGVPPPAAWMCWGAGPRSAPSAGGPSSPPTLDRTSSSLDEASKSAGNGQLHTLHNNTEDHKQYLTSVYSPVKPSFSMTSTCILSLVIDLLLEASSIRSHPSVQHQPASYCLNRAGTYKLVLHPELTAETCSSTERQDDTIQQVTSTLTCKVAPLQTLLSVSTCSKCRYCHLHLMFLPHNYLLAQLCSNWNC